MGGAVSEDRGLNSVKRFGFGSAFIIFPVVFLFAFAAPPDLLHPRLLGPEELIQRARGNSMLQFGHALVTLNTGLFVLETRLAGVNLGLLFLPIGFVIQTVALLRSKALPRWQSILFLVGVLFAGTPDGLEIVNLAASLLLACLFVPYGIQVIANR